MMKNKKPHNMGKNRKTKVYDERGKLVSNDFYDAARRMGVSTKKLEKMAKASVSPMPKKKKKLVSKPTTKKAVNSKKTMRKK